ncbi:toll/interleukin-1 receptor domain-containing protein [Nocardia takedensis]
MGRSRLQCFDALLFDIVGAGHHRLRRAYHLGDLVEVGNWNMIVFVSYARRDHQQVDLIRIKEQVSGLGQPYVDDLYDHSNRSRSETVVDALLFADTFVAVMSPHYLQTVWTRGEFSIALRRRLRLVFLSPSGELVDFQTPASHTSSMSCA